MWAPDRTQWFLVWVGFLLASYAVASDSVGGALFIAGIFGLLTYYRETVRRGRKAEEEAETELKNEWRKQIFDDEPVGQKPYKRYADMTKEEKVEAEIEAEQKHEEWKRKQKQ